MRVLPRPSCPLTWGPRVVSCSCQAAARWVTACASTTPAVPAGEPAHIAMSPLARPCLLSTHAWGPCPSAVSRRCMGSGNDASRRLQDGACARCGHPCAMLGREPAFSSAHPGIMRPRPRLGLGLKLTSVLALPLQDAQRYHPGGPPPGRGHRGDQKYCARGHRQARRRRSWRCRGAGPRRRLLLPERRRWQKGEGEGEKGAVGSWAPARAGRTSRARTGHECCPTQRASAHTACARGGVVLGLSAT